MNAFLFWLASGLIGYTYAGFPILVMLRARLRPRPHQMADVTPSVSVVIAAHDEERSIGARVENLLAVDYPRDCLEIVIASDGSTDRTVAEARREDGRVRVLDLPRTGKASALNAAVAASTGEILVFSDANTAYAPDAIRPARPLLRGPRRRRRGRQPGLPLEPRRRRDRRRDDRLGDRCR